MESLGKVENKTKSFSAEKKISSNNIEMLKNDPDFAKVASFKKWGIMWLKKVHTCKDRKKCGCVSPLKLLSKYLNTEDHEILIHSKYKGAFLFSKTSRSNYMKLIKKNRSLFETIDENTPRRLYLDIDGKNADVLDKAKEVLMKVLPKETRMAISGSVGEKRGKPYYSYHIVCPDIVFKDLEAMKTSGFIQFIKSQKSEENGIDDCVYGRNQQFKSINQSKHKSNRVQNVMTETEDDESHMIQVFTDDFNGFCLKKKFSQFIKLEIQKVNLKAHKSGKKCGIRGFTLKHIIPFPEGTKKPEVSFEYDSAISILNKIPNPTGVGKLGRTCMWCIMNWYYHEGGTTFEEFQNWEKPNERTTPQSQEDWDKCKQLKNSWGRTKIQHLLEAFYGALPDPKLIAFNKQFIESEIKDVKNTTVNEKYITKEHLSKDKYQLLKME